MVRPRTGDFLYTDAEFGIMREDIKAFREARADGVVLGILHKDGEIDTSRTKVCVLSPNALLSHGNSGIL